MDALENVLINIEPIIINFFIISGIIMSFVGIAVAIYGFYKKKWTVTHALKYFLCISGLSLFISTAGLLIISLRDYDINTQAYQSAIPCGYILSLSVKPVKPLVLTMGI